MALRGRLSQTTGTALVAPGALRWASGRGRDQDRFLSSALCATLGGVDRTEVEPTRPDAQGRIGRASDWMLDEWALSERLTVPVMTLRRWRREGSGPVYVKLGSGRNSAVRYPTADLEVWLASRLRQSTRDTERAVKG